MSKFLKGVELLENNVEQQGYFIPCLTGKGAPTEVWEGAIGSLYLDEDSGDIYKCIAINDNGYQWVKETKSTAADVGARSDTWMPTIAEIGAASVAYVDDRTLIASDPNNDGNIVLSYGVVLEGGNSGSSGGSGEAGGYYKPTVSEDGVLSWTASKSSMPKVDSTNIRGKDGKTPVKGTDYFTEADKAEMVEDVVSELPTNYKNKKILFMGDSITASSSGWVAKIADILVPSVSVNVAVSSARWCDYANTVYDGNPVLNGADNNANNVIGNQVEKVLRSKDDGNANYADFDMIFIAAGTNDSDPAGNIEDAFYANGAVVGVESVDRTTWQGAFRYCVEKLQGAYNNAKIFICTPIQAVEAKRSYASIKAKGDYLKKLSARMSVNCIDTMLCGICGLYEVNDASGRDLRDGLHTNDSGALKIAKYNAMMVMNYYAPEILEDSGEDEVVNLVPTSVDASGNIYGDGKGYVADTYISANSPSANGSKAGYVSTGFMPVNNEDYLYSSGTAVFVDSNCRVHIYDKDKTHLGYLSAQGTTRIDKNADASGNLIGYQLAGEWMNSSNTQMVEISAGIAFVRVCAKGTGDGFIVSTKPID